MGDCEALPTGDRITLPTGDRIQELSPGSFSRENFEGVEARSRSTPYGRLRSTPYARSLSSRDVSCSVPVW
ncbi:hypothetical protein FHK94_06675 [Cylindrospermopsis raciborskii CS-506_D]|nr:hypothetical protein [Cylindrospermopsis raciborskii]MBA4445209.1 hypothetical protein [Cylindrospermopsis raciborskii CS-506_C]MBA4449429.1 hypothetical protein [Cylindrospermopsis raciborskii CS-506_D]MBA4456072.1 hypothetical protein [Cylindrospermopsis raciborskii CS-506_B]